MADEDMSNKEDDHLDSDNAYVNQLTLNFLISKSQLHKLNKLKQKDVVSEPTYDKDRIYKLFKQLLNNDKPDDLLEDVKVCFDAFVEKSIYYLEIHDKNENIQNERTGHSVEDDILAEAVEEDINFDKDEYDEDQYDEDQDEEDQDEEDEEDDQDEEDVLEEYFEEPVVADAVKKLNTKYSKKTVSKGVEDIHKLPLDWFNTTRQNYKINQIIPRKKEIIINNSSSKKM
jgi:hypothetical protein